MTEEEIDKICIFATQCHNQVDEFRYRLTNDINFQMEQFREELLKAINIFRYDLENIRENNKKEQNNE